MDEQIRYQFARFKDFYDATKQHVTAESEEPLSFQVPKQAFAKGASLGKVKSPLRKLRKRMEKHLGGSPALLNHCWKELTREMVEMVKDVRECPDLDIMVIAPWAKEAHTPEESLNLESFRRIYEYLLEVFKVLCEEA